MSAIDKAIDQLEKSVERIREFSANESKAVQKTVRKSSGSARTRVESDYAATRKRLLKEARDAEKQLREAIARIEKAFGDNPVTKRAARSTKKAAPKRKTAAKPKAAARKTTAKAKTAAKKPAAKTKAAAKTRKSTTKAKTAAKAKKTTN